MQFDDLVLMPEPDARRALAGEDLRLRVLGPLGAFAGRGVLRVLRCSPLPVHGAIPEKQAIELVCGYESYEPL